MSTLVPHPSLPTKPTFTKSVAVAAAVMLPSTPDHARGAGAAAVSTVQTTAVADGTPEQLLTPWLAGLPMTEYASVEERLHDEIVAFLDYVTPNAAERIVRDKLIKKLTEMIQRRYWTSEVSVFGSAALDLSLLSGDIDMVINTPMVAGDENRKRSLFELAKILRETGFSVNPFVVKHARVPIITFEAVPELSSVKFDLSINATDGLTVLSSMKQYLSIVPALRPLIMTLKMFLANRGLHSAASGGLSSFTLTLMVISFLQLNPGNRPPEDFSNPSASQSLGRLLMDFFDYYHAKFPYETAYISVLGQKLGEKSDKGWEREHHPDALSVESIIDPNLDVGRSCQKIARIRVAFGEAFTALKSYQLKHDIDGRTVWHGNVLGAVLGVPSSAVARRAALEARLASGAFDAALARVPLPDTWDRAPQRTHERRYEARADRSERGGGRYDLRGPQHERQARRDRRQNDRGRGAREPERHHRERRDDERWAYYGSGSGSGAGSSSRARYDDPPAYRHSWRHEEYDSRSHSRYDGPDQSRCPW
ncbi:Nucleotidyltransferase [Phanerochaete sordida]|uniref:polynucleotide adenylyltransferase n=1 Tax=Phanerochaete sordida TaxID=48140 RepID=A0A9P3GQW7_9APHY|nr:Nucleotidyltransferase [Phanerochaete sordida]